MDCIEAREKIDLYVDDMLSEAEKQRLIWHASSCPQCKKALDEAIRLKQALRSLGEIEPPAGLVASAVRKAKKRRIPIYAYATAAAAAVIALAFALSPPLLNGNDLTAEGGEEKIMYSAADMNTEADEGLTMDSATAEEAMEAPQLECSLGAGAPLASAETESAAIAGTTGVYTFADEAELAAAIQNGEDVVRGIAYYYRPAAALPEGAALQQIEVSEYSVRWIYTFDGGTLVFEWLRTLTADDLQGWSDQTRLYSDTLAPSFSRNGDLFWSSEARFNDSGQMEAADGTTVNVYWPQDGAAFHAELPASLLEEDFAAYCVAEQVPIQ